MGSCASFSDSLLPGEYRSLSRGGSGVADFSLGGDLAGEGDLDRDLLNSLAAGFSDLTDSELESLDLDVFFLVGDADFSLSLADRLFDFFGDSFLAGGAETDLERDLSELEPDFSAFFPSTTSFLGESSFLARFLRFTGEAELSEDEDCLFFAFFVFFLAFLTLPSLEEPSEDEDDESLRAFFFLPRALSSDEDVECRRLLLSFSVSSRNLGFLEGFHWEAAAAMV